MIWGIEQNRVFTVSELEQNAPTESGGYVLYSNNGLFGKDNYLVYVGGSSSFNSGPQKGKCYEMVVTYNSSNNECFFIGYSYVPRGLSAPALPVA